MKTSFTYGDFGSLCEYKAAKATLTVAVLNTVLNMLAAARKSYAAHHGSTFTLDHVPTVKECRKNKAYRRTAPCYVVNGENVSRVRLGYNGAKVIRSWV